MKHPITPTLLLVLMFFTAQLAGLIIIGEYVDVKQSHETGTTITKNEVYERVGVVPPEIKQEDYLIYIITIFATILIGTGIVLLIIKYKKRLLWKVWYFFAVFFSLNIALNPFVFKALVKFELQSMFMPVLYGLTITLGLFKVLKPNTFVHNLTEIFIYGGIASILVIYVINIYSAIVLLVLMSLYDGYAVWKTKHMVKMAKFQSSSKMFAGLLIPYKQLGKPTKKEKAKTIKVKSIKTAILGGGDIAFPLIFSGAVMRVTGSYLAPFVITLTATIALLIILLKADKGKFYPAMPFLSLGCFSGLVLVKFLIGF